MSSISRIVALWRNLVHPARADHEVDAEVRAVLDLLTDEKIASGLSPGAARRAAVIELGGVEPLKEEIRAARMGALVDNFLRDARHGLRLLRRSPVFTVVAIGTLAVGIGACTAVFTIVERVLVDPLPYAEAGRLVFIHEAVPELGETAIPLSAPDYLDFERQNRLFESMAGFETVQVDLSGLGDPERLSAARVSPSLFQLLRVAPLLGRTFTDEEDREGARVVVIGYSLWQRRFGGDKTAIGRTVRLDMKPYTIVGVMPPAFEFPDRGLPQWIPADLWVPIEFSKQELAERGDNFNVGAIARLRTGISVERANQEAHELAQRIQRESYPAQLHRFTLDATVRLVRDEIARDTRQLLFLLSMAVLAVLLVTCTNLAGVLVARMTARGREIAVRRAIGAGSGRLLTQLLTESLLLGLLGGGLSVPIAEWGARAFVVFSPTAVPRSQGLLIDPRMLACALILGLASSLLFGVAPFLQGARVQPGDALRAGGRGRAGFGRNSRVQSALIVGEIALSLVLLVFAGLFIRSFERLRETEPGFRPERVLSLSVQLAQSTYGSGDRVLQFYSAALETLGAIPGVQAAGAGTDLPLHSNWNHAFTIEGAEMLAGRPAPLDSHTLVLGNYFETLGIPLERGRYFTEHDRRDSVKVVIINETMARRFWPDADPIGKRLKWGVAEAEEPWLTIVGIVGDVKDGPLEVEAGPHTYEPYEQQSEYGGFLNSLNIAVRAAGDPTVISAAAQQRIRAIDSNVALSNFRPMLRIVDDSMAPRRFSTALMSSFAVLALLLASLGVYGVTAYVVSQRSREIGIRIAIGADRSRVLREVIWQGVRLALTGVGVGLVGAVATTRFVTAFLFETRPIDPPTFAVAATVLVAMAALASCPPALRATGIDPVAALRQE